MKKPKNNDETKLGLMSSADERQSRFKQVSVPTTSTQNQARSVVKDDSLLQTMDSIHTACHVEIDFKKIEPKFSDGY